VPNRKYIDRDATRHAAIVQEQDVRCCVSGIGGLDLATKPKYVKNLVLGENKMIYDQLIGGDKRGRKWKKEA